MLEINAAAITSLLPALTGSPPPPGIFPDIRGRYTFYQAIIPCCFRYFTIFSISLLSRYFKEIGYRQVLFDAEVTFVIGNKDICHCRGNDNRFTMSVVVA